MSRLNSSTKGVVALSLAFAVLWSLLACASLCTLESTLHDSQASTCEAFVDESTDGVEPVGDCCVCPDIVSPAATTQQRETGEQILVLKMLALPVLIDIEPESTSPHRFPDIPDASPSKIHAPPLFLRLRTFRI